MARLRRNVCWYWGTSDPVGRGTPAVSCKIADPIVPQNRHRPHEYALSWRFGLFQAFWVVQPSKRGENAYSRIPAPDVS